MTKEQLLDLLAELATASIYDDNRISQAQYEGYVSQLETASKENLPETIRCIVYELLLEIPDTARRIAYPFSYSSDVIRWRDGQIKDGQYLCYACKKWHPVCSETAHNLDLTIDHDPPLSERFNSSEFAVSREKRRDSYNDTSKMHLMCRSKNSEKGGKTYNMEKIWKVFFAGF